MTAITATKPGECGIVTVERQLAAVAKAQVRMREMPEAERSLRAKIDAAVRSLDVEPLGRAFTLWRPLGDGRVDYQPGVIVSRAFEPVGEVMHSALPAGRAAHLLLAGPFDGLPGAWHTLLSWCAEQKLELAGTNWQIYGHESDDPSKQETLLYALLA